MQQSARTVSFWPLFHQNDRFLRCFYAKRIPIPQAWGCIFSMLGQKVSKTGKMAVFYWKQSKNGHFAKSGLLHSLFLSLLHMTPNMASNMSVWHFVFNPKEAWWTAPGHREDVVQRWPCQGAAGCRVVVVPWYGVGCGHGVWGGMANGGVWGYGQWCMGVWPMPVQYWPMPVPVLANTDQYSQYTANMAKYCQNTANMAKYCQKIQPKWLILAKMTAKMANFSQNDCQNG